MRNILSKLKWSLLGLMMPVLALAEPIAGPGVKTGPANLKDALESILNAILGIVGLIALAAIIIGGLMLITSGGDSEKAGKAKNFITYGIVGLVIIILSYAIVNFVITKIGV